MTCNNPTGGYPCPTCGGFHADPMPEGELSKQLGMARALSAQEQWGEDVRTAIAAVPSGTEGTFEHFRAMITPLTGEPRHPSAWGAISNSLIRADLLQVTAKPHEPTTTESNHACKRQILRRP